MLLAHVKQLEQEVDKQLETWEMESTQRQAREQYPDLFPKAAREPGVTPPR